MARTERFARAPPATCGHAGHIIPNYDTAGHTLTSQLCRVPAIAGLRRDVAGNEHDLSLSSGAAALFHSKAHCPILAQRPFPAARTLAAGLSTLITQPRRPEPAGPGLLTHRRRHTPSRVSALPCTRSAADEDGGERWLRPLKPFLRSFTFSPQTKLAAAPEAALLPGRGK